MRTFTLANTSTEKIRKKLNINGISDFFKMLIIKEKNVKFSRNLNKEKIPLLHKVNNTSKNCTVKTSNVFLNV